MGDSPSATELIGFLRAPTTENVYKFIAHLRSLNHEAVQNKISSPTEGGVMPLTLYIPQQPPPVVFVTNGAPPPPIPQDHQIRLDGGLVVPVVSASQLDNKHKLPKSSHGQINYYSMPLTDKTRKLKLIATQKLTGCTFIVGRRGNDIYFGHVQPNAEPKTAAKDLADTIGSACQSKDDIGGFEGIEKSKTSYWTYGANEKGYGERDETKSVPFAQLIGFANEHTILAVVQVFHNENFLARYAILDMSKLPDKS